MIFTMRCECNIRNGFCLTVIAPSAIGTMNVSRSSSGVTRERVRQFLVAALETLRGALKNHLASIEAKLLATAQH